MHPPKHKFALICHHLIMEKGKIPHLYLQGGHQIQPVTFLYLSFVALMSSCRNWDSICSSRLHSKASSASCKAETHGMEWQSHSSPTGTPAWSLRAHWEIQKYQETNNLILHKCNLQYSLALALSKYRWEPSSRCLKYQILMLKCRWVFNKWHQQTKVLISLLSGQNLWYPDAFLRSPVKKFF